MIFFYHNTHRNTCKRWRDSYSDIHVCTAAAAVTVKHTMLLKRTAIVITEVLLLLVCAVAIVPVAIQQ
jgi:hypothetical protein